MSSGAMQNLMTNDSDKLEITTINLHQIWAAPVRIILVLTLIGLELDFFPTLAGILAVVISMPVQSTVIKRIGTSLVCIDQ